jgi:hypothetical protein
MLVVTTASNHQQMSLVRGGNPHPLPISRHHPSSYPSPGVAPSPARGGVGMPTAPHSQHLHRVPHPGGHYPGPPSGPPAGYHHMTSPPPPSSMVTLDRSSQQHFRGNQQQFLPAPHSHGPPHPGQPPAAPPPGSLLQPRGS